MSLCVRAQCRDITHIWPWPCRRRWCRCGAATVVRPSPADSAPPEAAPTRTVLRRMTSSPTLSPLLGEERRHIEKKLSLPKIRAALQRTDYLLARSLTHAQPLTITPNITLMSVSTKQDALECHPFYGCLDKETDCRQVRRIGCITEGDGDKCDLTVQATSGNES